MGLFWLRSFAPIHYFRTGSIIRYEKYEHILHKVDISLLWRVLYQDDVLAFVPPTLIAEADLDIDRGGRPLRLRLPASSSLVWLGFEPGFVRSTAPNYSRLI